MVCNAPSEIGTMDEGGIGEGGEPGDHEGGNADGASARDAGNGTDADISEARIDG